MCIRDSFQALSLTPSNVGSALKIAGVNGVDGHAGISSDYSNVAPRLGFAYSARPGTVVRGGFGISYFPGNYTSNTDLKNVPFLSNFQPNCQAAVAIQVETNFLGAGRTVGNGQCAPGYSSFDQGLPIPTTPNAVSYTHLDVYKRQGH